MQVKYDIHTQWQEYCIVTRFCRPDVLRYDSLSLQRPPTCQLMSGWKCRQQHDILYLILIITLALDNTISQSIVPIMCHINVPEKWKKPHHTLCNLETISWNEYYVGRRALLWMADMTSDIFIVLLLLYHNIALIIQTLLDDVYVYCHKALQLLGTKTLNTITIVI